MEGIEYGRIRAWGYRIEHGSYCTRNCGGGAIVGFPSNDALSHVLVYVTPWISRSLPHSLSWNQALA